MSPDIDPRGQDPKEPEQPPAVQVTFGPDGKPTSIAGDPQVIANLLPNLLNPPQAQPAGGQPPEPQPSAAQPEPTPQKGKPPKPASGRGQPIATVNVQRAEPPPSQTQQPAQEPPKAKTSKQPQKPPAQPRPPKQPTPISVHPPAEEEEEFEEEDVFEAEEEHQPTGESHWKRFKRSVSQRRRPSTEEAEETTTDVSPALRRRRKWIHRLEGAAAVAVLGGIIWGIVYAKQATDYAVNPTIIPARQCRNLPAGTIAIGYDYSIDSTPTENDGTTVTIVEFLTPGQFCTLSRPGSIQETSSSSISSLDKVAANYRNYLEDEGCNGNKGCSTFINIIH